MRRLALACALLASLLAAGRSEAAWPISPLNAVTVTAAGGDQTSPAIAADGAGGAFIAWIDTRSGNTDIYATHVVNGAVVGGWTADGVAICTGQINTRYGIVVVPGNVGDVFVVWMDYRAGNWDIYAQRLLSNGTIAPGWPANGLALTNLVKNELALRACTDGAGGFYAVWTLEYTPGTDYDIYATRVLKTAAFASGFAINGVVINGAINKQQAPDIAPDGAGNAIIAFENVDGSNNGLVFAQLLGPSAQRPWGSAGFGKQVSQLVNNQRNVRVVSDGVGGALICCDFYVGTPSQAMYYLNSSGVVRGTILDLAIGLAGNMLSMVPDATGGAWYDVITGSGSYTYTLFHLDAGGVLHPSGSGITLGSVFATGYAGPLAPEPDGSVIAAFDPNSAGYSIEGQAFDSNGIALWNFATPVPVGETPTGKGPPVEVPDGLGGAIVAWSDYRTGNFNVYANRVDRFGALGDASASITSMTDVPHDQGGFVSLQWTASYLDVSPDYPIARYSIWRRVPGSEPPSGAATVLPAGARRPAGAARVYRVEKTSTTVTYWEFLSDTPARGYPGYSAVVPTTSDSTPSTNPLTNLRVEAETAGGVPFWDSVSDSGYSVDNLPPATPAPFTGAYLAGATRLHWGANTEIDLAGYRLYRGNSAGFVPSPSNLIAAKPDTGFGDVGPAGSYYKLSAIDIHGNESPFALLTPRSTLAVDGGALPHALTLAAPRPNPARRLTLLSFALPEAGPVTLAVYGLDGRRIRTVCAGQMEAGEHQLPFDLRDGAGRLIPSGLYFVQLGAGDRRLVRRLAIVE